VVAFVISRRCVVALRTIVPKLLNGIGGIGIIEVHSARGLTMTPMGPTRFGWWSTGHLQVCGVRAGGEA
jgi:hypothetical protein